MTDHGHRDTYDRSAADWHAHRRDVFPERHWIDLVAAAIPSGGAVLDLGCGSGHPVAAHLLGQGFDVTGADFSGAMLAIARAALPQGRWIAADMRDIRPDRQFDAVIAWDSLFHLSADEQQGVIAAVGGWLRPGGLFLFTGGPDAGESWGAVSGGPVWHASLTPAGYATCLQAAGMLLRRYVAEDPATAGRSVYLARLRDQDQPLA